MADSAEEELEGDRGETDVRDAGSQKEEVQREGDAADLAQSVERQPFKLVVAGSGPVVGSSNLFSFSVKKGISKRLLTFQKHKGAAEQQREAVGRAPLSCTLANRTVAKSHH